MTKTGYEVVVGLEVHAQLATKTKLFCACSQAFGAAPNTQTCAICLGMPGTLPALNQHAVRLAIKAALGLGLKVHTNSSWSRKNYFYPDLPKGYQITQFDKPIATGGKLVIRTDGNDDQDVTVGIERIHMEEDAGKNVHDDLLAGQRSYVDFNRGGTPLIEIVSAPDLRSSGQAVVYLKTLRQILRYLSVCDGNMEEGSLRCDANISLRKFGAEKLGTRVELKNINSFRFVAQAIDYEVERQASLLNAGQPVVQETRLWDTQAKATRSMRSKDEAHDYRYFLEPDLPNLILTENEIEQVQASLGELPEAKKNRFIDALGLSSYDAQVLVEDLEVATLFEQALAVCGSAKAVANWVINEMLRERNKDVGSMPKMNGSELGELVELVETKQISGKMAKDVFTALVGPGGSPKAYVKAKSLSQIDDTATLNAFIAEVLAQEAESVVRYRSGKHNVLNFLSGRVMQKSKGCANPQRVRQLLQDALNAPV